MELDFENCRTGSQRSHEELAGAGPRFTENSPDLDEYYVHNSVRPPVSEVCEVASQCGDSGKAWLVAFLQSVVVLSSLPPHS